MKRNVTKLIEHSGNDDELLPLTKCVCGAKFAPWEFVIGIYEDTPTECPDCGRKLYFSVSVTVYEVDPPK